MLDGLVAAFWRFFWSRMHGMHLDIYPLCSRAQISNLRSLGLHMPRTKLVTGGASFSNCAMKMRTLCLQISSTFACLQACLFAGGLAFEPWAARAASASLAGCFIADWCWGFSKLISTSASATIPHNERFLKLGSIVYKEPSSNYHTCWPSS